MINASYCSYKPTERYLWGTTLYQPQVAGRPKSAVGGVETQQCLGSGVSCSPHRSTKGKTNGETTGKAYDKHRKTVGKPWEKHRKMEVSPLVNQLSTAVLVCQRVGNIAMERGPRRMIVAPKRGNYWWKLRFPYVAGSM